MKQMPQQAKQIITLLNDKGFEVYAIGGSVRDILMDRPTHGWDFTTNAKPQDVLSIFPESFYDNQFGTVGIKIKDDAGVTQDIYEITTYRSEKEYTDHRHPDKIEWGKTLKEDMSRRDFTINTIAYDGNVFIDPYDGQRDITNKIIRTVGEPEKRFEEDALRMLRAVRIASELGFMIEENTSNAIKKQIDLLKEISVERITAELFRILASPYPADGIMILKNTMLLSVVLPEITEAFTIQQKSPKRHHIYDVGTHSVMALKHCPSQDPVVRFATLLHDIGKVQTYHKDENGLITFFNHEMVSTKIAKRIAIRLKLSKKDSERLITLIRWHQFSVDERQTDSALRRFIRHVGKENLDDMLALRIGDRLGGGARETSWRLELFKKRLIEVQKQPFTVADLKIDGHDVMKEYNCKPGPIIGKTLNLLFAEVEAGTIKNDREALLTKLKEINPQS